MNILKGVEASGASIGSQLLTTWEAARIGKEWGIFKKTKPAPTDDNPEPKPETVAVLTTAAHVEYLNISKTAAISTAPQENGAFLSYDKVINPYTSTIRFLADGTGGGNIFRQLLPSFLQEGFSFNKEIKTRGKVWDLLDKLVHDTGLYIIKTPEKTFKNANVVGYEVARSLNGLQILGLDVHLQEVRSIAATGWTNTKKPQGAAVQNMGNIQPQGGNNAKT